MSKEEKEILLVDLCARLPYNIIMNGKITNNIGRDNIDFVLEPALLDAAIACGCKPYLRPMSSMTEEEKEEVEVFIFNKWYQENSCKVDEEGWIEILANYDVSGIDPCFCSDYVDWLNAHHFDYRGLIPKGLALEALKDMYAVKN